MIMKTMHLIKTDKDRMNNNLARRSLISGVFFFCIVFLFAPDFLLAGKPGKVLIINSNSSVKKYSRMQTAFKANFTEPTAEMDIGSKWLDEKTAEKTILDVNPGLIFCIGSKAYLLASKVSEDANIIFSLGINWQRFPLTGKTYVIASESQPAMELTMYRYFFPEIKKVGVIYSMDHNKEWFKTAVMSGKEVDIEVLGVSIKKDKEIETALQDILPKVDALWLISDPIVLSDIKQVKRIFELSDAMKKPVFSYDKLFAGFGASLIISADIATMGGQAAKIADNILNKKEITEKVQYPAGSHIAINLKKIEQYGIPLNSKALSSVNDFIE